METLKVHVGAGKNYAEGWINTDIGDHKKDIYWDIREASPFDNDSVDFIFCEHVIEHLTFAEGVALLKEFFRIMKKGAIARVSTLDLDAILNEDMDAGFIERFARHSSSNFKYRSQVFNRIFYGYGHRCIFDDRLLKKCAYVGGFKFKNMTRLSGNDSQLSEVFNIDRRIKGKTTVFDNLVLEVKK